MFHVARFLEPPWHRHLPPRVQKHRANLKAQGMRPVQIWVPDTRSPQFAAECRRQSALIATDPHEMILAIIVSESKPVPHPHLSRSLCSLLSPGFQAVPQYLSHA